MRRRALGALPGAAILAGGCRAGERPAPAARPAVGTAVTPVQAPAATANAGGAHDAPAPAAAAPVAPVLAVGLRMLTFVDGRRAPALPSRRGGQATPGRTLVTAVYYPAAATDPPVGVAALESVAPVTGARPAGGPYPIVVFSHGLRGVPHDYQALLAQWVRAGAVVVAPLYPLTNRDAPEIAAGDLVNQPADATFVLTSVLAQAAQAGDPFAGLLDGDRVIAAGHSEGALTTVGLFTRCCRDPRLKGGLIMAGDDVGFYSDPFAGAAVPLLFFHGDADPLVPYGLGRETYARVPWPRGFVTLTGAGHIPPYLGDATAAAGVVTAVSTDYLRWVLYGEAAGLAAVRHDAVVPGVARFEDQLGWAAGLLTWLLAA